MGSQVINNEEARKRGSEKERKRGSEEARKRGSEEARKRGKEERRKGGKEERRKGGKGGLHAMPLNLTTAASETPAFLRLACHEDPRYYVLPDMAAI